MRDRYPMAAQPADAPVGEQPMACREKSSHKLRREADNLRRRADAYEKLAALADVGDDIEAAMHEVLESRHR